MMMYQQIQNSTTTTTMATTWPDCLFCHTSNHDVWHQEDNGSWICWECKDEKCLTECRECDKVICFDRIPEHDDDELVITDSFHFHEDSDATYCDDCWDSDMEEESEEEEDDSDVDTDVDGAVSGPESEDTDEE